MKRVLLRLSSVALVALGFGAVACSKGIHREKSTPKRIDRDTTVIMAMYGTPTLHYLVRPELAPIDMSDYQSVEVHRAPIEDSLDLEK